MYTRPSTTHRSGTIILGLAAAALFVFVIAGPGNASPEAGLETKCQSICIDAGGTFGPTVPVSINAESADRFIAIIEGDSGEARPVTMDFISVEEGAEIELLSSDSRTATVLLTGGPNSGRVGYVPVAWVAGA